LNIINIAINEIKRDFRDHKTLVFLLALPLVLMLVLGTALSSTFTTSITIDDMNVLYKDTTGGEFSKYFDDFTTEARKSGIHFKKAGSKVDGKKAVKQSEFEGYVEVKQSELHLYLNDRNSIESNILQGMLTSFVDNYNIATEVVKIAPEKIGTVISNEQQSDFIKDTSLLPNKQPGSMDYYAIVMTTMIALYAAMTAISTMSSERVRKTGNRLIASPIRKSDIFIGKLLGCIVINVVSITLVIAFSKIFFDANWGDHLGVIFLILLTEIVLAVSLGIGISYMTESRTAPNVIVMLIVQLSSFFGGAYFKLENPEGILKFFTNLSPLKWANTAITEIIYANNLSAAILPVTLNIGLSLLFLLFAVISFQKREGL
jgi:ABC-2 type transport system permease protein